MLLDKGAEVKAQGNLDSTATSLRGDEQAHENFICRVAEYDAQLRKIGYII
jgi:hypothetical protein